MKRRWLALAVVLLAVAVFVPVAEDVYVWVAYAPTEQAIESPVVNKSVLKPSVVRFGSQTYQWLPRQSFRRQARFKRYSALPGPEFLLHEQGCGLCLHGRHDWCSGRTHVVRRSVVYAGSCTCPHPSHGEKE